MFCIVVCSQFPSRFQKSSGNSRFSFSEKFPALLARIFEFFVRFVFWRQLQDFEIYEKANYSNCNYKILKITIFTPAKEYLTIILIFLASLSSLNEETQQERNEEKLELTEFRVTRRISFLFLLAK